MRSKTFLAVIFCLLLSVTASAQADWQEFKPEGVGFKIDFPCEPAPETITDPTTNGVDFNYDCSVDGIYFNVAVTTLGKGKLTDKEAFDAFQRGLLNGFKGELLRKASIRLGKYSGRSIQGSSETGMIDCRVYRVGQKIYSLVAATGKEATRAERDRFFESFALVKK